MIVQCTDGHLVRAEAVFIVKSDLAVLHLDNPGYVVVQEAVSAITWPCVSGL